MPAYRILVRGAVQGVGFRPFVFRRARALGLRGRVRNTTRGVEIVVEGRHAGRFLRALESCPPRLARIESVSAKAIEKQGFRDFRISTSRRQAKAGAWIMPDLATCAECRDDIGRPGNRRRGYPFTNCTQCGPRYSIIRHLPYDRPNTTMRSFVMCPACQAEYQDPALRRFHAQPNACPECGPRVRLFRAGGTAVRTADPITTAARLLKQGRILAVKGLGGFHLACLATDERVVGRLRRRKARPAKPFAIMVRDMAAARRVAQVNSREAALLADRAAPIVLLARRGRKIARAVAPGNGFLGVMLPYTPFHILLFATGIAPLVMTSANRADEPLCATRAEVEARLKGVFDYVLDHDRPIENRIDDSVLFESRGPVFVRRARGYAPLALASPVPLVPSLATGAEMKSAFALGSGRRIFPSPHIGELDNQATFAFYQRLVRRFEEWFRIRPELVACDLHPDYLATRFAEELGLPVVRVQHHHAHIASCLVAHGRRGPAIGLAFDGTGFGDDSKVWGGEFLVADLAGYQRVGHLRYLPLAGGERAIREPGRIAAGYLAQLFGPTAVERVGALRSFRFVSDQLAAGLDRVQTSSMGRLFDAVAAMLGLVTRATFDGEAAIALEAAIDERERGAYPFAFSSDVELDPEPCLAAVLSDIRRRTSAGRVAARFHNGLARAAVDVARRVRAQTGLGLVCLSGGVFQNRHLLAGVRGQLERAGFEVLWNQQVPVNDGGIAVGQIAVASQMVEKK